MTDDKDRRIAELESRTDVRAEVRAACEKHGVDTSQLPGRLRAFALTGNEEAHHAKALRVLLDLLGDER